MTRHLRSLLIMLYNRFQPAQARRWLWQGRSLIRATMAGMSLDVVHPSLCEAEGEVVEQLVPPAQPVAVDSLKKCAIVGRFPPVREVLHALEALQKLLRKLKVAQDLRPYIFEELHALEHLFRALGRQGKNRGGGLLVGLEKVVGIGLELVLQKAPAFGHEFQVRRFECLRELVLEDSTGLLQKRIPVPFPVLPGAEEHTDHAELFLKLLGLLFGERLHALHFLLLLQLLLLRLLHLEQLPSGPFPVGDLVHFRLVLQVLVHAAHARADDALETAHECIGGRELQLAVVGRTQSRGDRGGGEFAVLWLEWVPLL
mmetsp:Transcript_26264/g.65676  ORF Transcript_26264/g.65676 Transcript_26264/m.65676 type:complete len:314 (+) Transcript_26264:694-1635(+)